MGFYFCFVLTVLKIKPKHLLLPIHWAIPAVWFETHFHGLELGISWVQCSLLVVCQPWSQTQRCGLVSTKHMEAGMAVVPFGRLPGDRFLGLAGRHLIVCSSAAGVQRKANSGKGSCSLRASDQLLVLIARFWLLCCLYAGVALIILLEEREHCCI